MNALDSSSELEEDSLLEKSEPSSRLGQVRLLCPSSPHMLQRDIIVRFSVRVSSSLLINKKT